MITIPRKPKVPCKYCGQLFTPKGMHTHIRYKHPDASKREEPASEKARDSVVMEDLGAKVGAIDSWHTPPEVIILHAGWDPGALQFFFWAESLQACLWDRNKARQRASQTPPPNKTPLALPGRGDGIPVHPSMVPEAMIRDVLARAYPRIPVGVMSHDSMVISLPSYRTTSTSTSDFLPLPSPELAVNLPSDQPVPEEYPEEGETGRGTHEKGTRGATPGGDPGGGIPKPGETAWWRPWQVASARVPPASILEVFLEQGVPGRLGKGKKGKKRKKAKPAPPGRKSPRIVLGGSLKFWGELARLAAKILLNQHFFPVLEEGNDGRGTYRASWVALPSPEEMGALARLAEAMPGICHPLDGEMARDVEDRVRLLEELLGTMVDAYLRQVISVDLGAEELMTCTRPTNRGRKSTAPPRGTARFVEEWFQNLFSTRPRAISPTQGFGDFLEQVKGWADPLQQASSVLLDDQGFRTCFQLLPPGAEEDLGPTGEVAGTDEWELEYYLQARDDPSLVIPAARVWQERKKTLIYLSRRFENPQERLLRDLGRASRVFPLLEQSLRTATPTGMSLSTEQAYQFLREVAPLFEQEGFGVIFPPWWRQAKARANLVLRLHSSRADQTPQAPRVGLGLFGLGDLVSYEWEVAIGDELITPEEFTRLADLKTPLVQVRGQWVELAPESTEQIIQFYEARARNRGKRTGDTLASGEMTLQEALRVGLGVVEPEIGLPVASIQAEGTLEAIFQNLLAGGRFRPVRVPPAFHGVLRPYQLTGVSWLTFLRQLGFGGILADDMGLGKTIEVIAYLLHERENAYPTQETSSKAGKNTSPTKKAPPAKKSQRGKRTPVAPKTSAAEPGTVTTGNTLLICPMTVLGNWAKEVARFAPSLRVLVHHGQDRAIPASFAKEVGRHDIVATTYGLARRDKALFSPIHWANIILDEAQNIKNPGAKQTQAIKSFHGSFKIALTGTPIENRLAELWSIMDFVNPGYLGGPTTFHKKFAVPIEKYRDPRQAETLKRVIQPFVLRRLKTDKTIIKDLPKKIEVDAYCHLTREQATLYEAVVKDMLDQIANTAGIQRKGLVLSTITKLKQVCNHPAQFLHDHSPVAGRSGKLERLQELVEETLEAGDKMLIFSQFREMGSMLVNHLQAIFQTEVLFLHGGTSKRARDALVQEFQRAGQGAQLMVLSLKAGGVGLNLTAATRVVHFDRWWNPAVETQASDRAYRIGQTRAVEVFKFTCLGTLEEKIDDAIQQKQALADDIVGTGEQWITELSTDRLRDLFTLNRDALMEDS